MTSTGALRVFVMWHWTADGQSKPTPTAVLLNESIDKPGPTFCPDCGRLVVGHNPRPAEASQPPPTAQEYAATMQSSTNPSTQPSTQPHPRL